MMLTNSKPTEQSGTLPNITDNIYEQRYIKKRIRQAGC